MNHPELHVVRGAASRGGGRRHSGWAGDIGFETYDTFIQTLRLWRGGVGRWCRFLLRSILRHRISRLREIKPFDKWVALNWAAEIVFIAAMWYFFGPKAIIYLLLSFFFSVGLHPLGARWIQEHYLTHDEIQETFSYYGVLNVVAFNVGYHNEHHDFPSIPWNKLPQIKKTAPGYYDSLMSHKSWTKLFFRFLFDKEISLYSRIVRKERGKVALTDESKPDLDMVNGQAASQSAHNAKGKAAGVPV